MFSEKRKLENLSPADLNFKESQKMFSRLKGNHTRLKHGSFSKKSISEMIKMQVYVF